MASKLPRIILGHFSSETTEAYAEMDDQQTVDTMMKRSEKNLSE